MMKRNGTRRTSSSMEKTLSTMLFAIAVSLSAWVPVAQATDGVLEINQTCALQTGCFPGDAAGFPIRITAGGSYRLTSNLIVSDGDTNLIIVAANDVHIDLNRFSLLRSLCQGAPSNCTPTTGTGIGILDDFINGVKGVSVENGSVIGMGSAGIDLSDDTNVSNVRVRWNRTWGIRVGRNSRIIGSSASENGATGISASSGSIISENTSSQNGIYGFELGVNSTISGNTAYNNANDGINASSGSTISGNTSNENGGDGISVNADCLVEGNTSHDNGQAGIHATSGRNRLDGNNVTSNTIGFDVDAPGNLIVRNSARENGANYSQVVSGNTRGEVIDTSVGGGNLTATTSPWANFSY